MATSLIEFVRQYPLKSYSRNETIIFQNDQPSAIYFIKSGFVKGYDIDSQGAEQLLWLGSASDIFPLYWIFQNRPDVPYFFSAFSDVEAYAVPGKDLRAFLQENHHALYEVTKTLAVRLINTYHHLNAVEKGRTEDKILYSLYFLSMRFGNKEDHTSRINLPLTHQDIASLIGLSRETVTQELKKLKDRGYIYYDKNEFIIHQQKLETML